ncbi:hypothetical protein BDV29DRAFT_167259 [Aspergillus leporis]|jgi:hypothetical protein|uniref:Uncharacterized protein n=1 Tax=Aspergillus leporis TaxID=41062 RepID=A0A5N5XF92_9EURO|nr:hypothetical protein BDV29DRAFT_167259 [Aspergillus leporis]
MVHVVGPVYRRLGFCSTTMNYFHGIGLLPQYVSLFAELLVMALHPKFVRYSTKGYSIQFLRSWLAGRSRFKDIIFVEKFGGLDLRLHIG